LGPEYDVPRALLKELLDQYDLDQEGRLGKVVWEKTDSGMHRSVSPLCNFVVWPTRDILKDDGFATERFIELCGLLQGGVSLKSFKISAKTFLDMKWPIEAWGIRVAVRPRMDQELRYAIQLMAQEGIPASTIYTHLGWRKIDDVWVFLHSKGAVGSNATEVEVSDRLKRYSLPNDGGDLKEALKASLSILKIGPKRIMIPLYALVWLAPLSEILRIAGIEPSFLTYLWGASGTFKSTILALLLSHYGNFGPRGLPASFRDTSKSIEEMAFQSKDVLLVVDDLYPAKNPKERAKLEGVLEYLSRNQGDRQGRGRLNSSISLMSGHPPRGLTLSSGEVMPLSGSSLARGFVLHLLKEDIDQDKLTQVQAQQNLLPYAMRGYLEYLAPQIESLPSQFQGDFERLRDYAKKDSKVRTRHRRFDEAVAHLFLGLNFFVIFAVSQEVLSEDEAAAFLQDAWETLNQVADELTQEAERVEPVKYFFEALQELRTLGRVHIATMGDVQPEPLEQSLETVKIGWGPDERGVYYLLYGPMWEQVTKYLRAQNVELALSKDAFLDLLEQRDLLDRDQGGRRVIQKKIGGTKVRVLPVLEKAFTLEWVDDEN